MLERIGAFIGGILITLGSWFLPHTPAYIPNLGAAVTSTELSDTINTFRTNTNDNLTRINQALSSSTSTDPGHKHSTSTITGTFGIAAGGTATTTYTYGVAIASGTQPFSTIAPGTTNNILQSNGTAWISSSFNGGGFPTTTISQLCESTLAAATNTITCSGFAARNRLTFYLYSPGLSSANGAFSMFFNNDMSNKYGYRGSWNNGTQTSSASSTNIAVLVPPANFGGAFSSWGTIENYGGQQKFVSVHSTSATTTANSILPDSHEIFGQYSSTTPQITTVSVITNAGTNGNFTPSTTLTIYGAWQ